MLNERLGLERAEAVKRYLYEQHQVPLHKINVISYGEEKPVVAEQQPRRVARRTAASSSRSCRKPVVRPSQRSTGKGGAARVRPSACTGVLPQAREIDAALAPAPSRLAITIVLVAADRSSTPAVEPRDRRCRRASAASVPAQHRAAGAGVGSGMPSTRGAEARHGGHASRRHRRCRARARSDADDVTGDADVGVQRVEGQLDRSVEFVGRGGQHRRAPRAGRSPGRRARARPCAASTTRRNGVTTST